jgi:hypothetical protein
MPHKGLIREHVKGRYCQWYLVRLLSGKWASVWYASVDIDDLFRAIVMEDKNWFDNQIGFAPTPSYSSKKEALEYIEARCDEAQKKHPSLAEFGRAVENVRRALRKATREEKAAP